MRRAAFTVLEIADVLAAQPVLRYPEATVIELLTDSRIGHNPQRSLFFALTAQRNGHDFIDHAYVQGVRNFVVAEQLQFDAYADANFLLVPDTRKALQQLAAYKRNSYTCPVIGITGSNGKTIVKEWLFQLLQADYRITRSPKSFNSQIGVPLSVWQLDADTQLGIFEAGISKKGEMAALAKVIKPTIGIVTNIGEAHNEGFVSQAEKLNEKLRLFEGVDCLIYSPEQLAGNIPAQLPGKRQLTWGRNQPADLQLINEQAAGAHTALTVHYSNETRRFTVPFTDRASIANAMTCLATLLALGYILAEAAPRLATLSPISMRLVLLNGIDNCSVIDDSYSADSSSLAIALDFLNLQNQHPKRTVILSDLYESGRPAAALYAAIASLLKQKQVHRLIGIGPQISAMAHLFATEATFYPDTDAFIADTAQLRFTNETILVKGARRFAFERITKLLTLKMHDTVLEVNLNALSHNLQHYRSLTKPGVKMMVMVKAFSYGSGSFEIANLLQHQKVDYLAVAYADEGIALRKAGIKLPIMVMSPEPSAYEAMIKYRLEPEIYQLGMLRSFIHFLPDTAKGYPIHLKLDTGMHRLGFEADELPALLNEINSPRIEVASIFTHLVASEAVAHDAFTEAQIRQFEAGCDQLNKALGYAPLKHVLNTSGITRWPDAQFDMVRLGIGLYGFDSAAQDAAALQPVTTLRTTVTQVKHLKPHETVGYGRAGMLPDGGTIATVKIGYADGYSRKFGQGVGKMKINGHLVPTVGTICMDMCMLDVTGIPVKAGDEVIVFDAEYGIDELAAQIDTIPYEILTNVSQRVKRVYFYE